MIDTRHYYVLIEQCLVCHHQHFIIHLSCIYQRKRCPKHIFSLVHPMENVNNHQKKVHQSRKSRISLSDQMDIKIDFLLDSVRLLRIVRWKNVPSVSILCSKAKLPILKYPIEVTMKIPKMVRVTMDKSPFVVHRYLPMLYSINWKHSIWPQRKTNPISLVRPHWLIEHHLFIEFSSLIRIGIWSFTISIEYP